MIAYRADIDGLRAVAVMAVVIFHAFPGALSGGFVGVDVFFVISGYLITSILVNDPSGTGAARAGGWMSSFYERRVRRIFPALFAMFLATVVAGYSVLLPRALEDLGRGIFYATLFASNILLQRGGGYFAPAAEENPLLHTWSLGVEEQFYIVFPWLLWSLQRFAARQIAAILSVLALSSLVAAVLLIEHDRNAVFYLPQYRAWELLVGAISAMGVVPGNARRATRELLSWSGLLAIGFASVAYDSATLFPGVAALVPCLGACAIIHAGASGTSSAAALLSTRPFVQVGLISYSLYLWHWPLLVLTRYYAIRPLTTVETWAVIAASFAVSIVSYRYIERPIRAAREWRPRRIMLAAVGALFMFVTLGFLLAYSDGAPWRFGRELQAATRATESIRTIGDVCDEPRPKGDFVACTIGGPELGAPTFAVWGDSHAGVLGSVFAQAARSSARRGLFITGPACPPGLPDLRCDVPGFQPSNCEHAASEALHLLRHSEVRDLILVARWALYVEGTRYPGEPGQPVVLRDHNGRGPDNAAVLERSLDGLLSSLGPQPPRVWLLSQVPEVGLDVPFALMRASIMHREIDFAPTRAAYLARQQRALSLLERMAVKHGATILRMDAPLCDAQRCQVERDGVSLYADDDHLSHDGAKLVEPMLLDALRRP